MFKNMSALTSNTQRDSAKALLCKLLGTINYPNLVIIHSGKEIYWSSGSNSIL